MNPPNVNVRSLASVCLALLALCALPTVSGQTQGRPCVEETSPTFKVKRLAQAGQIRIGDRSLADWNVSLPTMEISVPDMTSPQWQRIRDAVPRPLFAIKVYMTWDDRYYYIAGDVLDNAVRAVPATSPYPYSGDCIEVYFAAKQMNSRLDIHDLVEGGTRGQAAFFQLEVPPVTLHDPRVHFADWRTDRAFVDQAMRLGFAASSWVEGSRWRAELRIPLEAFESQVVKAIQNGERLKVGLDYLDYSGRLAERNEKDNWGFRPDRVFCLDPDERYVKVPACMRSIVFEK